ncbi:hypothetical protein DYB38_001554 [Aphanomyces astaci]|uniref:Protein kinase domain-containing protein n=1 Tax=Aphanomyces astaci TaxID=112090 RepID=A0A397D204_APHAT|nr:hypothetical protein DYB38_001554 [Aphanomyces astaci]
MAPEMIRNKPYSHAVDWWALGALIYEMVTGYPPFRHNNRKKLLEKICTEKLSLPKFLHADTHSILKQLLERNVDKRLGAGKSTMFKVKGVAAIKQHPFFSRIDWGLLAQRKITPPVTPLLATNTGGLGTLDTSCFAESFTKMQVAVDETQVPDDHGSLFHRFSFTAADVRLRRASISTNSRINEEEQPIDEHDEGHLVSTISTPDDAATSVVESSTIDPHVAPQC